MDAWLQVLIYFGITLVGICANYYINRRKTYELMQLRWQVSMMWKDYVTEHGIKNGPEEV